MMLGDIISLNAATYLKTRYPEHAEGWISEFGNMLAALCRRWQVEIDGHECQSRFGAIVYGDSRKYGRVAIKLIPWFTPRLQSEISCYELLPYREMCRVYETDAVIGAILLKFMADSDAPESRVSREAVFRSLYAQRLRADTDISQKMPAYEAVLREVAANALREIAERRDAQLCPLSECIQRAETDMALFESDARYFIHGDAHEHNLLASAGGCALIDPLGYIAPFEFEYARYLGTAMRERPLDARGVKLLAEKMLPPGADIAKAARAMAIDVTLRACNTFIEGNTTDEIRDAARWAKNARLKADEIISGARNNK